MTTTIQPVPTDDPTEPVLPTGLIQLTQYYGEFEQKERVVWVRVAAISHFTEYECWRANGPRPRGATVHMLNGESIRVTETPECIAGSLA